MDYLRLAGSIVTLAGSLFLLLGALGVLRMPDLYTRMQAGTKAATLGSLLFLTGMALSHPAWALKLVLLIVFLIFTNPVSSHALARAAHYIRVPVTDKTSRDCLLAEEENRTEGKC